MQTVTILQLHQMANLRQATIVRLRAECKHIANLPHASTLVQLHRDLCDQLAYEYQQLSYLETAIRATNGQ